MPRDIKDGRNNVETPTGDPAQGPGTRINYLDNLRVIAMLLGVFVHAAVLGDVGYFEAVGATSEFFRMALFFTISGYLANGLIDRYGNARFLRTRLRNLVVPLIFGLIILNPISLWLVYAYNYGAPADPGVVVEAVINYQTRTEPFLAWYLHLWFLFSLIACVLCASLLAAITRWVSRLLAATGLFRFNQAPSLIAVAVTGLLVCEKAFVSGLDAIFGEVPDLGRRTLNYMVFYTLGLFLAESAKVHRFEFGTDPLLVTALAIAVIWRLSTPYAPTGAGDVVLLGFIRSASCLVLLAIGRKLLNFRTRRTEQLSESIYSVYLLHYLVLYVVANIWVLAFPFGPVAFLVVSFLTIAICLWIHFHLIEKSRLLVFLLNGRRHKSVRGPLSGTGSVA